jgi:hypothetical protein
MEIRSGNERYGVLQIQAYDLLKASSTDGKEKN